MTDSKTIRVIEIATALQQELKSSLSILEIMRHPMLKAIIKQRVEEDFSPHCKIAELLKQEESEVSLKSILNGHPLANMNTKKESHEKIKSKSHEIKQSILHTLAIAPGLSRNDLANRLDLRIQTVTARVCELIESNLVMEDGVKHDSDSNRNVKTLKLRK